MCNFSDSLPLIVTWKCRLLNETLHLDGVLSTFKLEKHCLSRFCPYNFSIVHIHGTLEKFGNEYMSAYIRVCVYIYVCCVHTCIKSHANKVSNRQIFIKTRALKIAREDNLQNGKFSCFEKLLSTRFTGETMYFPDKHKQNNIEKAKVKY